MQVGPFMNTVPQVNKRSTANINVAYAGTVSKGNHAHIQHQVTTITAKFIMKQGQSGLPLGYR
jgi:hypothetical protein